MQDLASWVFKKISGGDASGPHSGRGRPPPAPTPSPASGRGNRPGVVTQTLVPLNFSAVVAPLNESKEYLYIIWKE